MTVQRQRLPNRRHHEAFSLYHWQQKFHVGIGRDDKGNIREVWIASGKSGTQAETLARDSAVILSIALQHGVGIDELRHAVMRDANGSASGPIGTLLDLLAQDGNSEGQAGVSNEPRGPFDPLPSNGEIVYAD